MTKPPAKAEPTRMLGVHFPLSTIDRLQKQADAEQRKVGALIRVMVGEGLDRREAAAAK